MANWQVIRAEDKTVINPDLIMTEEDAREYMRVLAQETGKIYFVCRAPDLQWRDRELRRLVSGEYTELPWCAEIWWAERPEEMRHHYAHVSKEKETMVAFTESPEKGEQDRQTRIRAGAYLTRFFSNILTPQEIQFWCRVFNGDNEESASFSLAKTPDEIEEIYKNGPASCMSCDFRGVHPSRVYGGFDLAIAYIKKSADYHDEPIASRALVWPERKIYGRIYPTPERYDTGARRDSAMREHARLEKALRAEGYESGSLGSFNGARIAAIPLGDSSYAMPYLDGSYCVTLSSCGEFFTMSRHGEHGAQETNGQIDLDGGMICESCEDRMSEDDSYSVNTGRNHSESWCRDCYESNSFFCHGYEETYSDSCDSIIADDHNTYSLYYAERNFSYCDHTSEWVTQGGTEPVYVVGSQVEQWCQDARYENAFYCEGTSHYYWHHTYESVEIDGEIYEKEYAESDLILRAKLHVEEESESESESTEG